jgi:uncharacterized damage-inducible protein DinB
MSFWNPMTDSRFPVGKFQLAANPQPAQIEEWLTAIEETPRNLRDAVKGLTDTELDTPYRDGGWTVRQVIHHVADSHMHSYARFRFAVTEDAPTIQPYDEAAWAELPDAKTAPVEVSLALLDALHNRWMVLLRSFDEATFARTFVHPENGPMPLMMALQLYAWHGRHHTAHITSFRQRLAASA